MEQPSELSQLPGELLLKIFQGLGLHDLLTVSQVCKAWHLLSSSDLLWRPVCSQTWALWDTRFPDPASHSETAGEASRVWSRVCQDRWKLDVECRHLVSEMCWPLRQATALRRLVELNVLILEEVQRLANRSEPLQAGTRYFAREALQRLQNHLTVQEMSSLVALPANQLDQHLFRGACLIAKLRYPEIDVAQLEAHVDSVASVVRARIRRDVEVTRCGGPATQRGALAAVQILNEALFGTPDENAVSDDGFSGLQLTGNTQEYYVPENSFLNKVLEGRKGIPITLAIIYATIGRLSGIHVDCIGIPAHFLVRVGSEGSPEERFIDCFHGGRLLTRDDVAQLLRSMGVAYQRELLRPAAAVSVWARMCNNLVEAYRRQENDPEGRPQIRTVQRRLLRTLDMLLAVCPHEAGARFLRVKVELASLQFEGALEDIQALLRMEEAGRETPPRALLLQYVHRAQEMKRQHQGWCEEVRAPRPPGLLYRVGQVMHHMQYDYRGLIFGWDPVCTADEEWIQAMQVDRLSGGRAQPFYRVLVDEQERRSQSTYVAQENIELIAPTAQPLQLEEFGMHFLGFSANGEGSGVYVPNAYLRYRYPEDFA
ncbi:hypothetical protein KFL_001480060 [Klebsormidium nitens]|uniref:F-box domain-containing protein n=1 Tax=Klebsormidium nitens TaxID=105231 RepID=A0A1Y1I3W6_KLENI|nr:hypothetical protein KFL_001480060 [Klebsormidium nitens]|eukprot:GAQ83437.1 hypothetical protein KFL_001480060 [Klebsormidium nitens]